MAIHLKRAYEDAHKNDGSRVLVDRLWPRGVSKEDAELDDWFKALAPSTDLRKWFDHDVDRWDAFQRRYRAELKDNEDVQDMLNDLHGRHEEGTLTLVFGAKDTEHNNAVVLKAFIMDM